MNKNNNFFHFVLKSLFYQICNFNKKENQIFKNQKKKFFLKKNVRGKINKKKIGTKK